MNALEEYSRAAKWNVRVAIIVAVITGFATVALAVFVWLQLRAGPLTVVNNLPANPAVVVPAPAVTVQPPIVNVYVDGVKAAARTVDADDGADDDPPAKTRRIRIE